MNITRPPVQKAKIGSCPHGLPMGACPICNGGGGGGGGSKSTPRVAGEMSWNECYAMGQLMKAQKLAQQKKELAMHAQLHIPLSFSDKLGNFTQKIGSILEKLTEFIQKNQEKPSLISKTIALSAKLALPVLNVLKNISAIAQKTVNFIQDKLTDISDKLNAVFGELKASVEKKISDKFNDFKKKTKKMFGIFEPLDVDETTEEEKKIEESKRLFELKTVFNGITKYFRKKEHKE